MKRFVLSLLLLSSMVCHGSAKVGAAAPDFELKGQDGKTYSLSSLKGKWVVLEWYNKDCPFVRKHYDSNNMQELQKKYTEKGVTWLNVISSAPGKQGFLSAEDATKIRKEKNFHSTATLFDPDGKVGTLYGAKTTPHMYIVNPKGLLVYQGAIDDNSSASASDIPGATNYVSTGLDAGMAGKEIKVTSTRPYGCSVKYK